MRRESAFPRDSVETPAFIVRPAAIAASRDELARLCRLAGCRALYSLKALGLPDVLRLMVPQLAGFSASSLFEVLLVRHVVGPQVEVQVTSPGLRDRDCTELAQHCDAISFNSLSQCARLCGYFAHRRMGLRVNPQISHPGNFTEWEALPEDTDLLFYEGLHGAVAIDGLRIARHADLKIGIVPVINLEWIQKIHRDKTTRGYTTEAVTDTILRRMHAYVHVICPQFTQTDINFQRVPVVDTSNPFIARWIPTPDESVVVIRFRNPRGIDFAYLTSMIAGSWMSRANSIVIPGNRLDLAMQLILTPLINRLVDRARRAR